jgi:nitrate/TMAO reductase-like tetraheme cytochrome c subunit
MTPPEMVRRRDGLLNMSVRSHKIVRVTMIVLASLVGVVALGLLLTRITASPRVCGSCHEMNAALASWKESGHTQVRCPQCHEKPRPWYQFPQTLAVRSAMLTRDVRAHWSTGGAKAVMASYDTTPTIPDSTCLQCHGTSRKITMRFGTLINHNEHAKRNRSCVSCHLWTAHPSPGAERPMLLMERCFTCHGRTASAKAPGTCDVCHPKSFSLRPVSHKPTATWLKDHGKMARAGTQPCAMCHEKTFCTGCHGLDMPHPANWAKGQQPVHSQFAKTNRQVCVKCHPDTPNFCTMCHHKGWDPAKGPWRTQHPAMVVETGASFCLDCHGPLFCTSCHLSGNRPAIGTSGTGG